MLRCRDGKAQQLGNLREEEGGGGGLGYVAGNAGQLAFGKAGRSFFAVEVSSELLWEIVSSGEERLATRVWILVAAVCSMQLAPVFVRSLLATARLAQSAERKALNLVVVGSSPTVGVLRSLICSQHMQTRAPRACPC